MFLHTTNKTVSLKQAAFQMFRRSMDQAQSGVRNINMFNMEA